MERFVIEALIVSVGRTQSTDDNQEERGNTNRLPELS